MSRKDEFFIGYMKKVPARLQRFSLVTALLLVAAFGGLGFAIGATQDDPGPGSFRFDLGRQSATGVLFEAPYPSVYVTEGSEHIEAGQLLMLSGAGKRGVQARAAGLDGQRVTVSGVLLQRGTLDMLQVRGGEAGLSAATGASATGGDAESRSAVIEGAASEGADSENVAGKDATGEGADSENVAGEDATGGGADSESLVSEDAAGGGAASGDAAYEEWADAGTAVANPVTAGVNDALTATGRASDANAGSGGAVGTRVTQQSAVTNHGRWRISGEICDGKCLAGAMRPGRGVAHNACAQLCLAGGVPPVLAAYHDVLGTRFLMLGGADGGVLPQSILRHTAKPVVLAGRIEQRGNVLVMFVDDDGLSLL